MANPKSYYFTFAKFIPILLLISVASMAAALLWMLSYSDTTAIGKADIYWVFYLHIAGAVVALTFYAVVVLGSLLHLLNPQALMPIVFLSRFCPKRFCNDPFCHRFRSAFRSADVGRVLDLGLKTYSVINFAHLFRLLYFAVCIENQLPPSH